MRKGRRAEGDDVPLILRLCAGFVYKMDYIQL